MIAAARILGLLGIVAMGLAIGLHYDAGALELVAKFWLPISAVLAFAVAFWRALPSIRALSHYDSTPPAISGGRIFTGVVGAVLAAAASNFLLLLGIFVR